MEQPLRERLLRVGVPAEVLVRIEPAGLSWHTVWRVGVGAGLWRRALAMLWPERAWDREELARLFALAELIERVADLHPGDPGRFWREPLAWLGGKAPKEVMAEPHGLGIVQDIAHRILYGIYP